MYNENDQEVIQNIIQISVLLFVCVRLYLHRVPCSEAEYVFEDGYFGKAYVHVPTVKGSGFGYPQLALPSTDKIGHA